MPYIATKTNGCWRVTNTQTGQVKAKCTDVKSAQAQMRLLNMVDKYRKPINFK
jgi:hypothetical protein